MDEIENPELDVQLRVDQLQDQHMQFFLPYGGSWGQPLQPVGGGMIPIPREILRSFERVQVASFMGLLPELNR